MENISAFIMLNMLNSGAISLGEVKNRVAKREYYLIKSAIFVEETTTRLPLWTN